MDSAVNIIEIIDGKYKLNIESLRSIISLAQDCHRIALISIIGPKYEGKSLLINCLLNYLQSNNKESWPTNVVFQYNYGFRADFQNKEPVIQLWSKPFILEDENQRTAIFLMDSSYVFTQMSEIATTKMIEDIIGLLMLTSSTLIYIKSCELTVNIIVFELIHF